MRSYVKSVRWQVSGDINKSFVKDHPMIDHLPVSDLILKLYAFDIFLFGLPPLKRPKWFPFYARAMERTKNLNIIFLNFVDN